MNIRSLLTRWRATPAGHPAIVHDERFRVGLLAVFLLAAIPVSLTNCSVFSGMFSSGHLEESYAPAKGTSPIARQDDTEAQRYPGKGNGVSQGGEPNEPPRGDSPASNLPPEKSAAELLADGKLHYEGIPFVGGECVMQDMSKAFVEFSRAAEMGNAEAQRYLGIMHMLGNSVPRDMAQAAEWFRKAAENGDVTAACLLARLCDTGNGVPLDKARAVEWYRKAAEKGHPVVLTRLAQMLAEGDGIPQDKAEAAHWYRKAASQGDVKAQLQLGMMYAQGDGVPQDKAQAAEWFAKAAEGRGEAAFLLARMYETGDGVPQDKVKALEYYDKAARGGHILAKYHLGMSYSREGLTSQAQSEATFWFREAAEMGHVGAALETAVRYAEGLGADKDIVQAYAFLRLHMDLRDGETPTDKVESLKAALDQQMTPEQQSQARRKAAALLENVQWHQETAGMSFVDLIQLLRSRQKDGAQDGLTR